MLGCGSSEIRDEDRLPPVNMVDEFNPAEEEVRARIRDLRPRAPPIARREVST